MTPDVPPPNRAIGWYRFMLWMMPTCIALTTAFAFSWSFSRLGLGENLETVLWFAFNIASTIGIGLFEAKFDQVPAHPALGRRLPAALRFVLLQILIMPAVTCFLAIAYGVVVTVFF